MLDLLLISLILVFIIDLSGVMPKLNKFVWSKLYPSIKYTNWQIPLISCSCCSNWWIGIIYLIITGFSLKMLAYVALLSFMTTIFKDILVLLKDILTKIIDVIYKYLI